jgi:hypothetical protein
MKNAIIVALGIALVVVGCSSQSKADDKGYREFDTTWAHCVLVKDGGYNGNSPALSCVPNGKIL